MGTDSKDIYILSLGSGELPRQLNVKHNASLGLARWMTDILDLLMDANQESISQSCGQVLGRHFHRVAPVLTEEIGLDSLSHRDELEHIANTYDLTHTLEWLEWLQQE